MGHFFPFPRGPRNLNCNHITIAKVLKRSSRVITILAKVLKHHPGAFMRIARAHGRTYVDDSHAASRERSDRRLRDAASIRQIELHPHSPGCSSSTGGQSPRSHTHTEAVEALGSAFDRVSIYRALTDLTRARLLVRADEGDHVWRFSLIDPEHSHDWGRPRFVCVHCGVVICLSEKAIRMDVRGRVPRALRARRVEVQLRGECDVCFSS
jgi:Fur family ferric uptake transcriptional regulator